MTFEMFCDIFLSFLSPCHWPGQHSLMGNIYTHLSTCVCIYIGKLVGEHLQTEGISIEKYQRTFGQRGIVWNSDILTSPILQQGLLSYGVYDERLWGWVSSGSWKCAIKFVQMFFGVMSVCILFPIVEQKKALLIKIN